MVYCLSLLCQVQPISPYNLGCDLFPKIKELKAPSLIWARKNDYFFSCLPSTSSTKGLGTVSSKFWFPSSPSFCKSPRIKGTFCDISVLRTVKCTICFGCTFVPHHSSFRLFGRWQGTLKTPWTRQLTWLELFFVTTPVKQKKFSKFYWHLLDFVCFFFNWSNTSHVKTCSDRGSYANPHLAKSLL